MKDDNIWICTEDNCMKIDKTIYFLKFLTILIKKREEVEKRIYLLNFYYINII